MVMLRATRRAFVIAALFVKEDALSISGNAVRFLVTLERRLQLTNPGFVMTVVVVFIAWGGVRIVITGQANVEGGLLRIMVMDAYVVLARYATDKIRLPMMEVMGMAVAYLVRIRDAVRYRLRTFCEDCVCGNITIGNVSFEISNV